MTMDEFYDKCHMEDGLNLGDHMKALEKCFTQTLPEETPGVGMLVIPADGWCVIRVDGRAFHMYTKAFKDRKTAFSDIITGAMDNAAYALMEEFRAALVYSQSDEITIVIEPGKVPFSGKTHKLNSIAASVASVHFNAYVNSRDDAPDARNPSFALFDARSYAVNRDEAAATVLWRQLDGIKNSISAVAYTKFSQNALNGKNSGERISMLTDAGVDWHAFAYRVKYGLFLKRERKEIGIKDLAGMNEKARQSIMEKDGVVTRSVVNVKHYRPLNTVSNLAGMLFDGEEPELKEATDDGI